MDGLRTAGQVSSAASPRDAHGPEDAGRSRSLRRPEVHLGHAGHRRQRPAHRLHQFHDPGHRPFGRAGPRGRHSPGGRRPEEAAGLSIPVRGHDHEPHGRGDRTGTGAAPAALFQRPGGQASDVVPRALSGDRTPLPGPRDLRRTAGRRLSRAGAVEPSAGRDLEKEDPSRRLEPLHPGPGHPAIRAFGGPDHLHPGHSRPVALHAVRHRRASTRRTS